MFKFVRAMFRSIRCFFSLLAGVTVLSQAEAFDYGSAARPCMKHWNFGLLSAVQFTKALVL